MLLKCGEDTTQNIMYKLNFGNDNKIWTFQTYNNIMHKNI